MLQGKAARASSTGLHICALAAAATCVKLRPGADGLMCDGRYARKTGRVRWLASSGIVSVLHSRLVRVSSGGTRRAGYPIRRVSCPRATSEDCPFSHHPSEDP